MNLQGADKSLARPGRKKANVSVCHVSSENFSIVRNTRLCLQLVLQSTYDATCWQHTWLFILLCQRCTVTQTSNFKNISHTSTLRDW